MWLNRPNFASLAFFVGMSGAVTILVTSFWLTIPNPVSHQCRDTIELVKGSLEGAACDPDQTLTYMQDFSGEKYIVCRCRKTFSSDEFEQPEIPKLPEVMSPDDENDERVPDIDIKKDGTYL